jgi:hypothetical protein
MTSVMSVSASAITDATIRSIKYKSAAQISISEWENVIGDEPRLTL